MAGAMLISFSFFFTLGKKINSCIVIYLDINIIVLITSIKQTSE